MNNTQSPSLNPLILVVDDDRVTRMTICKVLHKSGYDIVEAQDGLEALDAVVKHNPEMVLMDVMMPHMDGYTACGELRKKADHQALPILMLTGLNDISSIDQAFESGATDFITKPINWTLLTQRVRYTLRTKAMGIALQRNQERLSQAQRIAKLGYWEVDLRSGLVHCSDELFWVLGMEPGLQVNTLDAFMAMVPEGDVVSVNDAIGEAMRNHQPYELEHRIQRPDGLEIAVLQQGQVVLDDNGTALTILGTIQDITERKAAEELIEYQAFYDSLTDLPNRRLFTDHVSHGTTLANQQQNQLAVLFMGLDRFKVVNDTMGHAAGDILLREVASRLKGLGREGMSIARFGADVFAILLEGLEQSSEVDAYVAMLMESISTPVIIQGQEFFTTASVGVSLYPHDGNDAESLLKAADTAMFRAKEEGGQHYQYFTADMNLLAQKRLQIESELRKALERAEFQVFYQPQVDANTRRIVSMEALIRWFHPERGIVSPLDFIPVAEDSGLIIPIGEWVLRTACRQTQEWNEKFGLNLRVGVNLSGRQFSQPDLVEVVVDALKQSRLPCDGLDLEVTESIAMNDIDGCIATLQQLNEMGIHSSMDDFGTGYSSLSYLQQMPLHTLKIDRAFVKDIKGQGENGEIARAIIAMSHSLGMNVIAEGVETEEQLVFLRDHRCDLIQGFYISKPLDHDSFDALLQAGSN
jgi:diguanylate cyclase (GGDEF)-like protein/PAS domain S-box-containing protein